MQIIKVGEKTEGLWNGVEGAFFDFSDEGALLKIAYNNPTFKEIQEIKKGKFQIVLTQKNGLLFILVKFGSLPWMDMPYHICLSKNLTELQPLTEGIGYSLQIILHDQKSVVHVLRLIGLGTKFSMSLGQIIADQLKQPMTLNEFERKKNEVYRNYSTEQLLLFAEAKYRT